MSKDRTSESIITGLRGRTIEVSGERIGCGLPGCRNRDRGARNGDLHLHAGIHCRFRNLLKRVSYCSSRTTRNPLAEYLTSLS